MATQNEEYKSVMTGSILYYCSVRAFLGKVGARPGEEEAGGTARLGLLVARVGLCGGKAGRLPPPWGPYRLMMNPGSRGAVDVC